MSVYTPCFLFRRCDLATALKEQFYFVFSPSAAFRKPIFSRIKNIIQLWILTNLDAENWWQFNMRFKDTVRF